MLSDRRSRRIAGLHHRRGRAKHEQFLVEGVRCVEEALAARWPLGELLVEANALDERGRALWAAARSAGVECVEVSASELANVAATTTPQPVLATAERRLRVIDEALDRSRAPILVVDGVQDPGNAGGLLRVAHAYGVDPVISLKGAADPFNPKAVRGSMGAIFHVGLACEVEPSALLDALATRGCHLSASVARGGEDAIAVAGSGRWALAVGSEGHGVCDRVAAGADRRVTLALPGQAESLNVVVAAGVLLDRLTTGSAAASRQRERGESRE